MATATGGHDHQEECGVCCKTLNALPGRPALRVKLQVVLNQNGALKRPNSPVRPKPVASPTGSCAGGAHASGSETGKLALIVADLHTRGATKPRTVKTPRCPMAELLKRKMKASRHQQVDKLVHPLAQRQAVAPGSLVVSTTLRDGRCAPDRSAAPRPADPQPRPGHEARRATPARVHPSPTPPATRLCADTPATA